MNNFNTSTEPVDIELSVRADWDLAQHTFSESIESIETNRYGTSLAYYKDWGNIKPLTVSDLLEINRKETLKRDLVGCLNTDETYPEWEKWFDTKTEMKRAPKDELADYVQDIMYNFSFEEGIEYAEENDLLIKMDSHTLLTTRGYSQGDYCQVVVPDEIEGSPVGTSDWIQEHIDHLFWDSEFYLSLTIDDDDDKYRCEIMEQVKNTYEYDKDELVEIAEKVFKDHEHKEYIVGFFKDNLPEYPEYP